MSRIGTNNMSRDNTRFSHTISNAIPLPLKYPFSFFAIMYSTLLAYSLFLVVVPMDCVIFPAEFRGRTAFTMVYCEMEK